MASPKYVAQYRDEQKQMAAEAEIKTDIRRAMLDSGYNNKTLAAKLCVPASTLGHWINNPGRIGTSQWRQLNKYLKIKPENLLLAAGFEAMGGLENDRKR